MSQYIALLRGINVGGNNRVEMAKLKKLFEEAGFVNVSTYINSGNVFFETDLKSEETILKKIDKLLTENFSFKIPTLIRSKKNIKKLIKEIPIDWKNDTEQRTDILFLWPDFDNKNSLNLFKPKAGIDNLKYVPGAIVWNIKRGDYKKSAIQNFIGTPLYKNMTARNVNTVRKLDF